MDPKHPNSTIQVVVVGDHNTGKTSLIVSAMTGTFPEEVPSVLLPITLPMDTFPDGIPVAIIDTSSDLEHLNDTFKACQSADVIVLTYSCDSPSTLARLTTFWLPELQRHDISVPVIVSGCKVDLIGTMKDEEDEFDFEQKTSSLKEQFREVVTCLQCSTLKYSQVIQVFYHAQNSILYPTSPLFDVEDQTLRPGLISALKRIFVLCDQDHDGVLNDDEIDTYQIKYHGSSLHPCEISAVKKAVQDKIAEGCTDGGLTLIGFLFLHARMIENGRTDTVWWLLRKCGYDNNIMLNDISYGDDVKELTDEAVIFLSECFYKFDEEKNGSLSTDELENLFSTAPGKPDWFNELEGMISLDRFISLWALMALSDPVITFAYLKYIEYAEEDLNFAFRDRNSGKNCFQCYVFGPEKAGKTALLNWLSEKSFFEEYTPTSSENTASNMVKIQEDGTKKTLIMREVPENTVESLRSKKKSLAACDIAVFVYDSCDEDSLKRAMELLVQFATHCEKGVYQVPCLIVSAKNDIDDDSNAIKVCENVPMGAEIPILSVSAKLRNDSSLFSRIVYVAQNPQMFIPETENGLKRKKHSRFLKHSLIFSSVAIVTLAVAGLVSYKIYASRKKLLRKLI